MKRGASKLADFRSWRLGATVALHGGLLAAAGAVGWNVATRPPPRPAEPFVFTVRTPAGRKAPDQSPAPDAMPLATPVPPTPAPPAPVAMPLAPEPTAAAPPAVTVARAEVAMPPRPATKAEPAAAKKRRTPFPAPSAARPQASTGGGRSAGTRSPGGSGNGATAGDGDGGAVLVASHPPRYPAAARAARREGTVTVRVTVNAAGRVVGARLHRSCGSDDLDAAAVAAVHSWKFRPAHHAGRAITSDALVRVRFSLR